MKPFAHIVILLTLLIGSAMQAETTEPRDMAKDGVIARYINTPDMFYLKKNGRVGRDEKQIGFNRAMNRDIYMGKPYRKLSRAEAEEYSVLDRIEVRRGALYYDGRRISTNRMFVIEIHGAYRWNGGVLLHGYTSKLVTGIVLLHENVNELGFINPTTGVCKFILTYQKGPPWPIEFLAPISSVNTANSDFVLDVKIPETVSPGEMVEINVTLTNVSDRPLPVPEYLFGGMGISFRYYISGPGGDAEKTIAPDYHSKPAALENKAALLEPSQTRTSVYSNIAFYPFQNPGRYNVRFVWDGFLDESDPNAMSRFECVRWLDVKPTWVNDSSKAFDFDVTIPQTVSRKDDLELSFSLTNKTQRHLLVPEYLLGGLAIKISCEIFDELGNNIKNYDNFQYFFNSRERINLSNNNRRTPLGPSEKRENSDIIGPLRPRVFEKPGRYRVVFTWEGFLNQDDWSELTRFTAEKWVEVTK